MVDVMMKSDVVPTTKTLFTWLPPYLIDRIKFDVGTATTRFNDVVPRTKTLFTWLPPYLIDRIKFDVGTATTRFEFGVAAIMRFKVSAYSVLIFFRSR